MSKLRPSTFEPWLLDHFVQVPRRLGRGPLPRECCCERPSLRTEPLGERPVSGEAPHGGGQRLHIAMTNQETSLTIADGFPDAR